MRLADDVWNTVRHALPISCVDLVVSDGARVLMVERRVFPRGWWFPGGRVLLGEPRVEAARRKLREECGLGAESLVELGTHDVIFAGEVPSEGVPHAITTLFLARPLPGPVLLDAQSERYQWRTPAAWLDELRHPFLRLGIELAAR
jgi:ADP-ribose pyrophosphatase YjhB (NUDIX family)